MAGIGGAHLQTYQQTRCGKHVVERENSAELADRECYVQRIQPLLTSKKVREIAELLQVSQPYAAFVRSGRRRPHPRHWQALNELVSVS